LDGASWAVALELLEDLERFETGPVRGQLWREAKNLHPVIAALPTLTEVSRAAFFAGKRPKVGEILTTAADRDRFANHKGLGAFGVPKLLLASDAVEAGGGVTAQARKLIAGDDRVVGVVVNAVDDQLRSGPQLRPHYGVEDIRPMRDLLREARAAGRAVLLAADHGHVPGARLQYLAAAGEGGGARWRPLATGEEPGPKEVAVGGEAAYRRRGVDRVALLWAEDACYSAGAREGEHGGAAMAEVIAPAVLLAATDLARTIDAEGGQGVDAEVRSLPHPRWWDLEVPPAQAQPVAELEPAPGKAKAGSTAQVALPFAAPPAPSPAPTRPAAAAASGGVNRFVWLGKSKVLDEMLATHPRVKKDQLLQAVRALGEQEGRMAPEVFANRIGELPRRIAGVVSHFQEVLNLEGYQVLRLDRGPGGLVELDLRRLEELFKEGK
ncbi:MAG: BREX-2 system phosphatase PglZ, partial [Anaeromyxobacteraceae bacterium]|nr:BREX-2 system phosphatase PglZ [Anaeromyxobacteraceae bacterium]